MMHNIFDGNGVHYLEHQSLVIPLRDIPRLRDTHGNESVTLYGSPISLANGPRSTNAWFQYGRASEQAGHLTSCIPERMCTGNDSNGIAIMKPLDILITHGAPYGKLDRNGGCAQLALRGEQVAPLVHIFGHGTCAHMQ